MENKFLFYAHGSSLNHGCDAIVKSTYSILTKAYGKISLDISTLDKSSDKKLFDFVNNYISNGEFENNFMYDLYAWFVLRILKKNGVVIDKTYRKFYKNIGNYSNNTIMLSVGGDNYCCANPEWLYRLNAKIDENNFKRVLWGCSVEPETCKERMIEDLNKYKVIHARESITYESLMEKKVNTNMFLRPDPAFVLPCDSSAIPDEMKRHEYVGINLSPVIISHESNNSITHKNYYNLIRHILKTTDLNIALIPHVVIRKNNDYDSMGELYKEFSHTGRVLRISDKLCAEQYKGIIAQCKCFIGARTHSTIAAYSSCVPTLVIGYSVKAKGIAKDLFGTYDGYVIPVQNMSDENEIIKAFDALTERSEEDKRRLTKIMPTVKEEAFEAGLLLKKYLEDN